MISVTYVKAGNVREIKLYKSLDKAKKDITPVVKEMRQAEKEKRKPKTYIDAVSYDHSSERTWLLEIGAFTSIDNESKY